MLTLVSGILVPLIRREGGALRLIRAFFVFSKWSYC